VIVFWCFQEKGENLWKGVSKTGYGGRGCAAQHRGTFYLFGLRLSIKTPVTNGLPWLRLRVCSRLSTAHVHHQISVICFSVELTVSTTSNSKSRLSNILPRATQLQCLENEAVRRLRLTLTISLRITMEMRPRARRVRRHRAVRPHPKVRISRGRLVCSHSYLCKTIANHTSSLLAEPQSALASPSSKVRIS
jgi:hypothetical protein